MRRLLRDVAEGRVAGRHHHARRPGRRRGDQAASQRVAHRGLTLGRSARERRRSPRRGSCPPPAAWPARRRSPASHPLHPQRARGGGGHDRSGCARAQGRRCSASTSSSPVITGMSASVTTRSGRSVRTSVQPGGAVAREEHAEPGVLEPERHQSLHGRFVLDVHDCPLASRHGRPVCLMAGGEPGVGTEPAQGGHDPSLRSLRLAVRSSPSPWRRWRQRRCPRPRRRCPATSTRRRRPTTPPPPPPRRRARPPPPRAAVGRPAGQTAPRRPRRGQGQRW